MDKKNKKYMCVFSPIKSLEVSNFSSISICIQGGSISEAAQNVDQLNMSRFYTTSTPQLEKGKDAKSSGMSKNRDEMESADESKRKMFAEWR